ncbi:MAG: gamma-glutamylcyclotransferase [Kofleriaceae bacterium]
MRPGSEAMVTTASKELWLFGYGSLMWRPDLAYHEARPAVLAGYQRRFWQKSTDHRGTPAHPGRVVTLAAAAATTLGVAYHLASAREALVYLDHREQQGYERRTLPVQLADGRTVDALVYVADPGNPYFVADEPLAQTAAIIATARGPSGTNLDYARALVATLAELARAPEEAGYERALLARAEAHLAAAR